jgi:hypothetical protein
LETTIVFRLILYWNQTPISGSFYDWKMLSLTGCIAMQTMRREGLLEL